LLRSCRDVYGAALPAPAATCFWNGLRERVGPPRWTRRWLAATHEGRGDVPRDAAARCAATCVAPPPQPGSPPPSSDARSRDRREHGHLQRHPTQSAGRAVRARRAALPLAAAVQAGPCRTPGLSPGMKDYASQSRALEAWSNTTNAVHPAGRRRGERVSTAGCRPTSSTLRRCARCWAAPSSPGRRCRRRPVLISATILATGYRAIGHRRQTSP